MYVLLYYNNRIHNSTSPGWSDKHSVDRSPADEENQVRYTSNRKSLGVSLKKSFFEKSHCKSKYTVENTL